MSTSLHDQELALRHSRRSLWFATIVVALFGIAAIALYLRPDSDLRLMPVLPILLVIGIAALVSTRPRGPRAQAEMQALQSDELRQLGLNHAWRNGFLVMLLLQPVLVLVASAGLKAVIAITAGFLAVLGSLLWYDR
ncbi:MAG: hypothetical protein V4633_18645 [Pseudomonadota bacterium]